MNFKQVAVAIFSLISTSCKSEPYVELNATTWLILSRILWNYLDIFIKCVVCDQNGNYFSRFYLRQPDG